MLDHAKLLVPKSHKQISARLVRANEVFAVNHCFDRPFNRAIARLNRVQHRSWVIDKREFVLAILSNDILPVLSVEADLKNTLPIWFVLRGVPDEASVREALNKTGLTHGLMRVVVDKPGMGSVGSLGTCFVLELNEAPAFHDKLCPAMIRTSFWRVVLNVDILCVCEGVLDIAVVQRRVRTVVLSVTRGKDRESTWRGNLWRNNNDVTILIKLRLYINCAISES